MNENGGCSLDGFGHYKRAAKRALLKAIAGDIKWLRIYSDEHMQEYLSADDYALWLSEKAKHGIVHSRYEVPPES